jgi:hypothetical protein
MRRASPAMPRRNAGGRASCAPPRAPARSRPCSRHRTIPTRPIPLTHSETSRAYCRVVRCASGPRRPGNRHWPGPRPVARRYSSSECRVHLGQFESDGPAGLALADGGAVDGVAVGRHVIDAQRHEIAAAQLAVDGEVEQGQVSGTPLQLQLRPDGPHVTGPQRWLRTGELALVARGSRGAAGDDGGLPSFMVGHPSCARALQETRLPARLDWFGDAIRALTPAQAACGRDRGST